MKPTTYTVAFGEKQHLRGLLHLSRQRAPGDRSWHIWLGPAGAHVFWPDMHKSRPGWCPQWRQPLE